MMRADRSILITVASWEDRFYAGTLRVLAEKRVSNIIMYFYKEYSCISEPNRMAIENVCQEKGITLEQYELSFDDPVATWKTLFGTILNAELGDTQVCVDITTMPRESIWTIFDFLQVKCESITYIYNLPDEYNKEWLSRDPGKPRLVFKLGGEARMGLPTKLVILSGFDLDRVRQMISFFEPQETLIGVQIGEQFENQSLNIARHRDSFGSEVGINIFYIDAYSEDHGLAKIESEIMKYLSNSNIIMTSLGPKLSAVSLFLLQKRYPQIGLAYAPSREFNPEYSHGIKQTIIRELIFRI